MNQHYTKSPFSLASLLTTRLISAHARRGKRVNCSKFYFGTAMGLGDTWPNLMTQGILLLINLIVDVYAFRYSLLSTINMLTMLMI